MESPSIKTIIDACEFDMLEECIEINARMLKPNVNIKELYDNIVKLYVFERTDLLIENKNKFYDGLERTAMMYSVFNALYDIRPRYEDNQENTRYIL